MTSFDATHAYDAGYHYATRGVHRHVPPGTWLTKFSAAFLDGYDQAMRDGRWGSNQ